MLLHRGGVQPETTEIDCKVVARTPMATLIDHGGTYSTGAPKPHVWLPNSEIVRWVRDSKDKITGVELPVWLAVSKDLI